MVGVLNLLTHEVAISSQKLKNIGVMGVESQTKTLSSVLALNTID